jgi:hypothetical protein
MNIAITQSSRAPAVELLLPPKTHVCDEWTFDAAGQAGHFNASWPSGIAKACDPRRVVPSPSVAKLSSASVMAHDSDTEGQGDRNEKGKQQCLSASGNKKCVCHKKTNNVDVCEED